MQATPATASFSHGIVAHGVPSPEPVPSMPMPLPGDPNDPDHDPFAPLPADDEPTVPVDDPEDGDDAPVREPGQPVRPPQRMQ